MHFWIDKRSQTCGFGRARVAASLGGGSVGLGFGGPPRRMISKPSAAAIHRMQSSNHDTSPRPPHTNSNNSSHSTNSNTSNNISANNTNNSNRNNNNRNRSNNNGNSNSSSPYQQRHPDNNHHNRHHLHNQQQYRNHHNSATEHHHSAVVTHNLPRTSAQLLTVNNPECHIPVSLPHSYGGPSNFHDLEQGSMGIETYPLRAGTIAIQRSGSATIPSDGHIALVEASHDVQLLPPHLKFGMCASLVLASVFIAGAKYYFDHQGGNMDVLIFCAFLAISFLALCTISLCRYVPRDLTASPSISVDGHSRILDGQLMHHGQSYSGGGSGTAGNGSPHPQLYTQNLDPNGQNLTHSPSAIAAPPPPYHIAILLPPENGKELQLDESPPPSYDKILI